MTSKKHELILLGCSTAISLFFIIELNHQIVQQKKKETYDDRSSYADLPLHDKEHHFCKVGQSGRQKRIQSDLLREYIEVPNQQYFEYRNGNTRFHAYNRHGYRSNNKYGIDLIDIRDIKKTVWIFGDSYTRGSLADNSETIPAQLSTLSKDNITFISFGVGGQGYLNALKHFEWASHNMNHKPLAILHLAVLNDIKNDQRTIKRLAELNSTKKREKASDKPSLNIIQGLEKNLKRIPYINSRLDSIEYTSKAYTPFAIKDFFFNISKNNKALVNASSNNYKKFLQRATKITPNVFSVYIPSLYEKVGFENMNHLSRALIKDTTDELNIKFIDLSFDKMEQTARSRDISFSSKKDFYGHPDNHYNEKGYYIASLAISDFVSTNSNFKFRSKLDHFNHSDFNDNQTCPN